MRGLLKKGNIPVYVLSGASLVMSLVGYIYLDKTTSLQNQVDAVTVKEENAGQEIAALKADNETVKTWLTRVEGKLDTAISHQQR